ncbi:unnamed protein product [Didymodactylos carnosus]|uniref:Uncharacterized protein n=1 Tax=Didymodactylos carnosus TaxID=1234261 RepID=A0A8S2P123_9BILA|nr:unnamed protein product [Didymodactylos carnosus]CAF4029691.1 unnamed protein product [Didymodactylos carnosus]
MKFLVHLIDFERQCEIYNMPIQTLYDYALIHKQNANIFFEKKIYSYALKLYHRSLSYASNFTTDEPNEENNELLKELDKLIVSIYTNIATLTTNET